MTMPHHMNCAHSDTGWCLDCVGELWYGFKHSEAVDKHTIQDLQATIEKMAADLDTLADGYQLARKKLREARSRFDSGAGD